MLCQAVPAQPRSKFGPPDGVGQQMRDLLLQNRVGRQADRVSVNRGTEMGALPYKSGLGFRNRAGLGGGSNAVKSGHLFNGSAAN